ncbi:hypothetical protein GUJ93_ZPchr1837g16372 [Zizania palustris]|uniref:Uncharacterized protein n=1 Tax=Zizania palustris TaxID=103762 RepID=A0A8J5SVQ0_ZIZPA|nr:hypothetical protein GUJ93_ZPchr1837g16372 [Zizania palustris]
MCEPAQPQTPAASPAAAAVYKRKITPRSGSLQRYSLCHRPPVLLPLTGRPWARGLRAEGEQRGDAHVHRAAPSSPRRRRARRCTSRRRTRTPWNGGRVSGGQRRPPRRHAARPSRRSLRRWVPVFQIKDMALKASGAYRHCKPCAGRRRGFADGTTHTTTAEAARFGDSDAARAQSAFHYAYRRAASSAASTPRLRGGGRRALSSGDATPSMSARSEFPMGEDEDNDDEMVSSGGGGGKEDDARRGGAGGAGVLITFVSLPQGGNDLKRIRFSLFLRILESNSHF